MNATDQIKRTGRVALTSGYATESFLVREHADGYLEYYLTTCGDPFRWVTLGEECRERITWDD